MWDEWLANPDHCRDHDGPDSKLQLYVRTDTQVIEDDVYIRGKALRHGDKQAKKAGDDAITSMRRRVQTGFSDEATRLTIITILRLIVCTKRSRCDFVPNVPTCVIIVLHLIRVKTTTAACRRLPGR